MPYREVRVRPVVRYLVTDYFMPDDAPAYSVPYGEFDNADHANKVADALARSFPPNPPVVVEPARALKIHWLRGPGEPKEAIRWVLDEDPR